MKTISISKRIASVFFALIMLLAVAVPTVANASAASMRGRLPSRLEKTTRSSVRAATVSDNVVMTDICCDEKGQTTYWRGDANLDGEVNSGDAVLVLRFSSDLITLSDTQRIVADANKDSNVNTGDASMILRISVGIASTEQIVIDSSDDNCTITYSDGVADMDIAVPASETVRQNTQYSISSMIPERAGYAFLGWQHSVNHEIYMAGGVFNIGNETLIDLTAMWRVDTMPTVPPTTPEPTPTSTVPPTSPTPTPTTIPNTYTLSYAPGATNVTNMPTSVNNLNAGDTVTVSDIIPARSGFTFTGWQSSEGATVYQAGSAFVMPAKNATLTATWSSTPSGSTTVTFKFYDALNEANLTSANMVISETTVFNASNIPLPEGTKLIDAAFSATVNVGASTQSVTVNVYPFAMIETKEYRLISAFAGLANIADDMTANYMLKGDIDCKGQNMYPIGWVAVGEDPIPFTGIFDGDNHKLSKFQVDMWITGVDVTNTGMFAKNQGTIKNLTISTTTFDDNANSYGVFGFRNVGAVVGRNEGIVENCHVSGCVGCNDLETTSGGGCGGVVGSNTEEGSIIRCSMYLSVEGTYWVGGITGKNFGVVDRCWFIGGINSSLSDEFLYKYAIRYVGGLAGGNTGKLTNSYVICLYYIAADNAVGGLIGWLSGGTTSYLYVYKTDMIYIYSGEYIGVGAGYVNADPDVQMGLYNLTEAEPNYMPPDFDTACWDLNAEGTYLTLPDLIDNRRTY